MVSTPIGLSPDLRVKRNRPRGGSQRNRVDQPAEPWSTRGTHARETTRSTRRGPAGRALVAMREPQDHHASRSYGRRARPGTRAVCAGERGSPSGTPGPRSPWALVVGGSRADRSASWRRQASPIWGQPAVTERAARLCGSGSWNAPAIRSPLGGWTASSERRPTPWCESATTRRVPDVAPWEVAGDRPSDYLERVRNVATVIGGSRTRAG